MGKYVNGVYFPDSNEQYAGLNGNNSSSSKKKTTKTTSSDLIGPTQSGNTATVQYSTPIGPTQNTATPYLDTSSSKKSITQSDLTTAINNAMSAYEKKLADQSTLNTQDTQKKIQDALLGYQTQQAQQKELDTKKYINDQTNSLNSLTEAQKNMTTNNLKTAYNKAVNSLTNQEGTIRTNYDTGVSTLREKLKSVLPTFQQNRDAASAQTAQATQALAERLAASGNAFGGQAVRDNIGLQTGLSNALNAQNLAEANTKADYANQENVLSKEMLNNLNAIAANKNTLETNYADQIAAALNEIEAQKNQEMMNLNNQGMNYNIQGIQLQNAQNNQAYQNALQAIEAAQNVGLQNSQLQNSQANQVLQNFLAAIGLQQNISDSTYNKAVKNADITGYYNPNSTAGTPTVNYDPNDIQSTINQLKATNPNDPNIAALENIRYNKIMSDPTLKAQYGDQYKTTQQKASEQQAKLQEQETQQKNELYKYQIEAIQLDNQIKKLEADPNSELYQNKLSQAKADLSYKLKQIDAINANIAQTNAQTANIGANNDLERQYKLGQIALQDKQLQNYDSLIGARDNNENKNDYDMKLTSVLDSKTSSEREQWLKSNKANIVKDKGLPYYNSILNSYGIESK